MDIGSRKSNVVLNENLLRNIEILVAGVAIILGLLAFFVVITVSIIILIAILDSQCNGCCCKFEEEDRNEDDNHDNFYANTQERRIRDEKAIYQANRNAGCVSLFVVGSADPWDFPTVPHDANENFANQQKPDSGLPILDTPCQDETFVEFPKYFDSPELDEVKTTAGFTMPDTNGLPIPDFACCSDSNEKPDKASTLLDDNNFIAEPRTLSSSFSSFKSTVL